ncbi:TPA: hypothetical protein QDZ23_000864 [Pseudomonas putida]|nr:hypothetical protein [Pseudomonas putida]
MTNYKYNHTFLALKKMGYGISIKKHPSNITRIYATHEGEKIEIYGQVNENQQRKTKKYLAKEAGYHLFSDVSAQFTSSNSIVDSKMREILDELPIVHKQNAIYCLKKCLEDINKYRPDGDKFDFDKMVKLIEELNIGEESHEFNN